MKLKEIKKLENLDDVREARKELNRLNYMIKVYNDREIERINASVRVCGVEFKREYPSEIDKTDGK